MGRIKKAIITGLIPVVMGGYSLKADWGKWPSPDLTSRQQKGFLALSSLAALTGGLGIWWKIERNRHNKELDRYNNDGIDKWESLERSADKVDKIGMRFGIVAGVTAAAWLIDNRYTRIFFEDRITIEDEALERFKKPNLLGYNPGKNRFEFGWEYKI